MTHSAAPVALITGASSGLGRAIAAHLAHHGYCVFGTSRKPDAARAPEGVTLVALDVHDAASIAACVADVLARAGRIDVLINNAGMIGVVAAAEEIDSAQLRAVFETNFFGAVAVTQAVLPHMRRQDGGQIIMLSSLAGTVAAPPFFSAYIASKHALDGYANALRLEVAPFNIHVTLVQPGYYRTAIDQTLGAPAHPLAAYAPLRAQVAALDAASVRAGRDPQQVAELVYTLVRRRTLARRYTIGLDAHILGLAERFLPHALVERAIALVFLRGAEAASPDGTPRGWQRLVLDAVVADRALAWGKVLVGVVVAAGVVALGRRGRRR